MTSNLHCRSLLFCIALLPGTVAAQTPAPADTKTLFTWRDAALAGGFAALTIAMFPIDRSIARRLQDSSNQANHFFRNASRDVQYVADPGSIVIGVSMYGIGRATGWRQLADLGLHGTEAVLLSGGITATLKGLAGRSRPYVSSDTNPRDFHLGRGIHKGAYQSFPSGHTTTAFAAAAAVSSESRRWWPQGQWLVGTAMYGGAALVGLSRMYNNAHWASDVALGAAVGTFSGLKVVRYNHHHPDNFIDRALLSANVSASASGATVSWTIR